MADIRGFRSIRYNFDSIDADPQDVLAPPYDVIDSQEQAALYERHPENIIRLILNKKRDGDDGENNRYTRARRHMMDWLSTGTLTVDDDPGLYVHYQDYEDETGTRHTRRGFLGLVRLSEYDQEVVLPHERTLRGPKEDRLELMRNCDVNMSPVFLLYEDPDNEVDELLADHRDGGPELDVTTEDDGIRHRMWTVDDGEAQCKVAGMFDDKQLLIADGHHRYETALAYRNFRRETAEEAPAEDAPYEYVMAFFVNMHDPGLQVFPTHRIVHDVEDFDPARMWTMLQDSAYFNLERLPVEWADAPEKLTARLEEAGEECPCFIFMGERLEQPLLVRYVGDRKEHFFDEETGEHVRKLDTTILHEAVLDHILGIDKEAQEAKTNLGYTRDLDEAVAAASDPSNQLVVLMNPTPVEHVVDVCREGGKMPQKSTYFYPKVLSGLTINPL